MRFLSQAITICFGEEEGFDCKNNHGYSKLTNFWLDNISKINSRTLSISVIYFIMVEIKKNLIGPEALQIVCPITMQLIVNSY